MRELNALFAALTKSAFRQKFHLQGKDLEYLQNKGLATIMNHADDFISKRLAPALPDKDGKQTPFRGHPVFVAQHATACCCRGCLSEWHQIPQGHPLTDEEKNYILSVLKRWLLEELQGTISPAMTARNVLICATNRLFRS
jgi:Domain of unknown function (DUF4186)